MTIFTKPADGVFAPYNSDGSARSVDNHEVQVWGTEVETVINAFISTGGLLFSSKAALDADLAHAANSMAWVIGDATTANNGVYRKVGASGSGSWTRVSDLPFSFIIASDVGAGAPNAIQATTSIPVSASALIWMNVFEANTGSPVTVSFNGGSALTIKTNAGNNVAAGGLVAGTIVLGIVSGSTFRLVSDQASAAIVAAAEAAQAAAEAAAASINQRIFTALADAQAATIPAVVKLLQTQFRAPNYAVPATLVGGARYRRISFADLGSYPALSYFRSVDRFMPDGSTDATNGGYWVIDEAVIDIRMLGAVLDGTDNGNTAAIQAMASFEQARSAKDAVIRLPAGDILLSGAVNVTDRNLRIVGEGFNETRLRYTSGSATINFLSTDTTGTPANAHTLETDGLTIVADVVSAAGAGPVAINAAWSYTGSAGVGRAIFKNTHIIGAAAGKWWQKGIRLVDAARVTFDNVEIYNLDGHQTCLSPAAVEIVRNNASNITGFFASNFWLGRFVNGFLFSQAAAAVTTGTIEGIYLANGEIVNVAYGIQEDNAALANAFFDSVAMTNVHINASRAFVLAGRSRGLRMNECYCFAQNFGDSTPAPLEAGFKFRLQSDGLILGAGNSFTRSPSITAVAPLILFPDMGSVNWARVDGNQMSDWEYVANSTGALSDLPLKLFIGKNSYINMSTLTPAGLGFKGNMTTIGGNGSVATGTVINFGHTFSGAPAVVAVYRGNSTSVRVWVDAVTTTGFTLRHDGAGNQTFSWGAVGT